MSKIVKTLTCAAAVFAAAMVYSAYLLFSSPFGVTENTPIYIDNDDTMDSVRYKVQSIGKVSNMQGYVLASALKRFSTPRTGCYEIVPGESMFFCVRRLANGSQIPVKLIVPQVRTIDDLVERLAPQLMISESDIKNALANTAFIDSLGYSKETLPCLFVPNTYEVYWNMSAEALVTRLNKERKSLWTDERKAKADALHMSPEEVTTLASIVESETSYGPEKATVAGLYLHRMSVDMPLQSDPTVIFAIGDFTIRRVLTEQLHYDSPYNTYMYKGLPPGPIRISSIEGIDAVLNHDNNTYLYMCAKEDFSGSHNFTSSYAEHLQNARRYQQALNQRGIKK